MNNDRPAQSRECELSMLATLLAFPDRLPRVAAILRPGDFYDSRLGLIYQAIVDLRASANEAMVLDWLTARKMKEAVGGINTIAEVLGAVPVPGMAETFAGVIADRACTRSLQAACLAAYQDGFSWQGREVAEYAAATMERVRAVASQRRTPGALHSAAELVDILAEEVLNGRAPQPGVPTGFPRLDRITGGFRAGELSVLAARPSMGKSAVMMNLAANVAAMGRHVLVISLEDTRGVLMQRMLARYADVPYAAIRQAKVDADGYFRVVQARDRIRTLPLHIDDTQGRTTAQLRATIQDAQDRGPVDLVLIDHLHRIVDRGESETQRYSAIVTRLADMAAQTALPVVLLAQLSRGVESRQDKRPELSDLRQSGTIEEVARLVLLLYRGSYYNREMDGAPEAELNVAKASQGETGLVQLHMALPNMYVREWEQRDGEFRYIQAGGGADAGKGQRWKGQAAPVSPSQYFVDEY